MTTNGSIIEVLNRLVRKARAEQQGLDAAALVAARDAVEMHETLMVAVRNHHYDTQHIHAKGVYPQIRLADVMLYEAAGLQPIEENQHGN